MKCDKCGKEINEQAKFCKYCGTPVQVEKQVSSANAKNGVSRKNSKTWLISKRQILMRSDTKLPQPFASWSNSPNKNTR